MKQLNLDDAAVDSALERLLPELEAEGLDPKLFALRLLYRCTLERLRPFPLALRQRFAMWLVEDLLGDGEP